MGGPAPPLSSSYSYSYSYSWLLLEIYEYDHETRSERHSFRIAHRIAALVTIR